MERFNCHSDSSITYLSENRPCRVDESLRSEACKLRGGQIEPERARSARYCSICAPLVRRKQSKLGKRNLRLIPRWCEQQRELRKQRRKEHKEYMREWRQRRRQAEMVACDNGQRYASRVTSLNR